MRLAVAGLTALMVFAGTAQAEDVNGLWRSATNDNGGYIHVDIGPCSSDAALVCGKIVEAFNEDPAKLDKKRRDEIVGKLIIENMEADGSSAWSGGTIWAPDDDETYSSEMELKGQVLEVSGCVLGGLICRGQDWTRVK
jgi:uncharacterized protein (DUF2147 family)